MLLDADQKVYGAQTFKALPKSFAIDPFALSKYTKFVWRWNTDSYLF